MFSKKKYTKLDEAKKEAEAMVYKTGEELGLSKEEIDRKLGKKGIKRKITDFFKSDGVKTVAKGLVCVGAGFLVYVFGISAGTTNTLLTVEKEGLEKTKELFGY